MKVHESKSDEGSVYFDMLFLYKRSFTPFIDGTGSL